MGALEEVMKLKAARRAEIAAAEEEQRQDAERAHRDSLARLEAAVRDTLTGQCASWLYEYRADTHAPEHMPGIRRSLVVSFDVPGHRRIGLDFQRVENARGEWIPLYDDEGEWTGWYALDVHSHPQLRLSLVDALLAAEIEGWTPPAQPEPERSLSKEAEHAARLAWSTMIQPDHPLPPAVAIDLVQDVIDDRDDAVSAIHWAAAAWLDSLRPEQPVEQRDESSDQINLNSASLNAATACRGYLLGEEYVLADNCRLEVNAINREIQSEYEQESNEIDEHGEEHFLFTTADVNRANAWCEWCKDAATAIDLCRAVAAAAHPEPASST